MTTPPQSPRAHLRSGHCDYCTRQLPHPKRVHIRIRPIPHPA